MDEKSKVERVAEAGKTPFIGAQTVFNYFSQVWIWRLHLHVFYRDEPGDAYHDHPWSFVTFPLVPYVEQVLDTETGKMKLQVLKRFRFHYRPATHVHRFMGKWSGEGLEYIQGKVYTICWISKVQRDWKYWRFNSKGKPVGLPWKPYLTKMARTPPNGRDQRL